MVLFYSIYFFFCSSSSGSKKKKQKNQRNKYDLKYLLMVVSFKSSYFKLLNASFCLVTLFVAKIFYLLFFFFVAHLLVHFDSFVFFL